MTLLVRDEADIVSSHIEFHLHHGVDFVVATDNLSVDATPEILQRYERQGVLHYIHQPDDDYAQDRWVTHMA
jgi:Glycosyltransferase family 92